MNQRTFSRRCGGMPATSGAATGRFLFFFAMSSAGLEWTRCGARTTTRHELSDYRFAVNRTRCAGQASMATALLLFLSSVFAVGADVMNFEVFKRRIFWQGDSGTPISFLERPFGAVATVNLTSSNAASAASISLPSGSVMDLNLRLED